jgi:hypothetical protein
MSAKRGPKDRPNSAKDRKAYNEYYRERGLCPHCKEHRPLANGRQHCPECLKRQVEAVKKCKAALNLEHKCYGCYKPLPEGYAFKACEECLKRKMENSGKKYAAMVKQRRYYRVISHRCTKCGKQLEDRDRKEDGSYLHMCFDCRLHMSELNRRSYQKRKAARQS